MYLLKQLSCALNYTNILYIRKYKKGSISSNVRVKFCYVKRNSFNNLITVFYPYAKKIWGLYFRLTSDCPSIRSTSLHILPEEYQ